MYEIKGEAAINTVLADRNGRDGGAGASFKDSKKSLSAFIFLFHVCSVADPDPGSGIGCLFDRRIRDPGWEKVSIRIRDPG